MQAGIVEVPAPEQVPAEANRGAVLRHTFAFRGEGLALFTLILKNMLLTLVTLGIYLPWAKTERRKYIWQNIEIAGHRLRYHGTGRELFIGYAKVLAAYGAFLGLPILINWAAGKTPALIVQITLVLGVIAVVPYAIWGARRYLLSRTSWRGIHFRLDGSASHYAKVLVLGYLLTIVTLGFYAPIWLNRMYRVMTDATAIGTRHFEYRGDDKEAFRIGIKGFLLTLVTLGLYGFWYQASLLRFHLENTHFDGARGQTDLSGSDFLMLTCIQVFGITFSLGLAFPWVASYSLQYVLARVRFVGPIDYARIYQAASTGNATADGLADALDVGLAL
jgi:uncharacterized membrane protein YjgN (DUF898 family)